MYLGEMNCSCSQIISDIKSHGEKRCSFVLCHWRFAQYGHHLFHTVLSTMAGRKSHQVDLCSLSCSCVLRAEIKLLCGYLEAGGWHWLFQAQKKRSSDFNSISQGPTWIIFGNLAPEGELRQIEVPLVLAAPMSLLQMSKPIQGLTEVLHGSAERE